MTVVFCDVIGSTALGKRLDPETARDVVSRYFATAQAAFERHGGTVERFIGDAVMAVIGAPAVHEDDALRAVRAVIELRDALERLNAELERDHGVRIVSRTGVNTGEGSWAGRARRPTSGWRPVTRQCGRTAGAGSPARRGDARCGDPRHRARCRRRRGGARGRREGKAGPAGRLAARRGEARRAGLRAADTDTVRRSTQRARRATAHSTRPSARTNVGSPASSARRGSASRGLPASSSGRSRRRRASSSGGARRSGRARAPESSREAVRLARDGDRKRRHHHRAEVLADLAEVLRASGDLDGTAQALREAVALHEEKGNILNAQRCRELLAGVATPAS